MNPKKSIKIMFEEDRQGVVTHLNIHLIENGPKGDEVIFGLSAPPIDENGDLTPFHPQVRKDLAERLSLVFETRSREAFEELMMKLIAVI